MAFTYVLVALSLLSVVAANSPGFGGWQTGRATYYGEQLQRRAIRQRQQSTVRSSKPALLLLLQAADHCLINCRR
jgi:hypothetical protein